MMPGTQKKMQRIMLISRSLPMPFSKATATGGRKIQRIIVRIFITKEA